MNRIDRQYSFLLWGPARHLLGAQKKVGIHLGPVTLNRYSLPLSILLFRSWCRAPQLTGRFPWNH